MFKKLIGFTLAELILVMAIIGTVAALVLPNLNNNVNEKQTVSKLRKDYVELQTAYAGVISEYGPVENWYTKNDTDEYTTELFAQRFFKHLQTKKVCGFDDGCFEVDNIASTDYEKFYSAVLKDGTAISVALDAGKEILSKVDSKEDDTSYLVNLGSIYVDIDSKDKGYNRADFDMFEFIIDIDDIKPKGYQLYNKNIPSAVLNYTTAWVIKAGNMDYLRCLDELDWDTKKTCK